MKPGDTVTLKERGMIIGGPTFQAGERFTVSRCFQTTGGERLALERDGQVLIPQIEAGKVVVIHE